jgi:hypothetical protein
MDIRGKRRWHGHEQAAHCEKPESMVADDRNGYRDAMIRVRHGRTPL